MNAHAGRPCVVHLVRAVNDPASFEVFLESWRRCRAGTECELVLAMKGFDDVTAEAFLRRARELEHEVVRIPDRGFDLGAYFDVAALLRRDRYCFLNSHSELLADGWLAKLDEALAQPQTGIVGATGSWASVRSWVAYALRLPSAYRPLLPDRSVVRQAFAELDLERAGESTGLRAGTPGAKLRGIPEMLEQLRAFEPFPSQHLRTNAFMISHSMLSRLRLRSVERKMDAYLLENGRASITRQVQRLGLRALVVDRAGAVYDAEQWHQSHTLWQRAQEGLLVADNQTRFYARGGSERRALLSAFAWGSLAAPSKPSDAAPEK